MNVQAQPDSRRCAKRIAIIGAGPIGIEAALHAHKRGFDVNVYEAGEVGSNVTSWGHVTLFTPFELNSSTLGRTFVREHAKGAVLPLSDVFLTGREFVDAYLKPLAQGTPLHERVHTHHRVIAVGRPPLLKPQDVEGGRRQTLPFRLLIQPERAEEFSTEADIVIDASGTYPRHNWVGDGGIPAIGERAAGDLISYELVDPVGADRSTYAGRTVAVVGAGYSAATTLLALDRLIRDGTGTRVVWITNSDRNPPIRAIPNDRLVGRQQLAHRANQLAKNGNSAIVHCRNASVIAIRTTPGDGVNIEVRNSRGATEIFEVDRIIANVGYQPDNTIHRELHVHECYATGAPMKTAAALLADAGVDSLDRKITGVDSLLNPEPGFFVLGVKSYGRDPSFLMKNGMDQIRELFSFLVEHDHVA